jgi:hypothetical protein
MAVWGGALAGLGVGIAVASLIHAIEQASQAPLYTSFGWTVFWVVIVGGLALGFGLGTMVASLVPDLDRSKPLPLPLPPPPPTSFS